MKCGFVHVEERLDGTFRCSRCGKVMEPWWIAWKMYFKMKVPKVNY